MSNDSKFDVRYPRNCRGQGKLFQIAQDSKRWGHTSTKTTGKDELNNALSLYHSFECEWTFTFAFDGNPLNVYQLVGLVLIIRHDDQADPPPVWDPSHFGRSKLPMNLLEDGDELEAMAKVFPIPWYHRGLGVYHAHTREPKNILGKNYYHVQPETHFKDDTHFLSLYPFTIINDKYHVKLKRNSVAKRSRRERRQKYTSRRRNLLSANG